MPRRLSRRPPKARLVATTLTKEVRIRAGLAYVTSIARLSVAELYALPEFTGCGVSRASFEKWAQIDRWSDRRDQFQLQVNAQFFQKASDRIVGVYLDTLPNLEKLEARVDEALLAADFKDADPVALVRAKLKIIEARAEMTQGAVRLLTPRLNDAAAASGSEPARLSEPQGGDPQQDGTGEQEPAPSPLSDDEAFNEAQAELRRRVALSSHNPESADVPPPPTPAK